MVDVTTEQTITARRVTQPQAEICTVLAISNCDGLYDRNQMRDTPGQTPAMEAVMLADPIKWTGHGVRAPFSRGVAA